MTGHTSTVAGNASKMHVVHVFVKVFSVSRGPYPRHQAVWGGEKKTPQAVWWRGGKKKNVFLPSMHQTAWGRGCEVPRIAHAQTDARGDEKRTMYR